jgi:hypothetical protein
VAAGFDRAPVAGVEGFDRVRAAQHSSDLYVVEPVAEWRVSFGWDWRGVSGLWGVAKSYRPVLRDQSMLLPVDMRDWLPGDHLVWFVLDTVDVLDIGEFEFGRRGGAGAAGYDPRMLLGLLIYAYCHGCGPRVRSSGCVTRTSRFASYARRTFPITRRSQGFEHSTKMRSPICSARC